MNKNFRVITINGVRGVLVAIFIVLGLISGFVISPGWVCMKLWNYIFQDSNNIALMNIYQGIMLWAIIALSLYALNNKKSVINFGSYHGLSPEQIRDVMERARESELKMLKSLELKQNELKQNIVQQETNIQEINESLPKPDKSDDFSEETSPREEIRR